MMWPKDDYQEQMLGYLAGVQIERVARSRHPRHDLGELYADLDVTSNHLWQLIGATEQNWEGLRIPLEVNCDALLRAFYRLLPARAVKRSARFTMKRQRSAAIRGLPERAGYSDTETTSQNRIGYPAHY